MFVGNVVTKRFGPESAKVKLEYLVRQQLLVCAMTKLVKKRFELACLPHLVKARVSVLTVTIFWNNGH